MTSDYAHFIVESMVDVHDDQFKKLYLSTAREYVQALTRDLGSLSRDLNNPNYISQIRISAHSLKGQSNAVGYTHIAAVSHLIEETCRRFLEEQKEITLPQVNIIQQSLTFLTESLDTIELNNTESDLTKVEETLQGVLETK